MAVGDGVPDDQFYDSYIDEGDVKIDMDRNDSARVPLKDEISMREAYIKSPKKCANEDINIDDAITEDDSPIKQSARKKKSPRKVATIQAKKATKMTRTPREETKSNISVREASKIYSISPRPSGMKMIEKSPRVFRSRDSEDPETDDEARRLP